MKKWPKKNDRPGIDEYGRDALINSVIANDIGKVKNLIENKANINIQDDNGWSPLHFAAQEFNEEMISFLLNNNANPNLKDANGNTPLSTALFNSKGIDTNIFNEFLKYGGDPELKNNYGVSAIDLAEQVDNFNLKKYFPKHYT